MEALERFAISRLDAHRFAPPESKDSPPTYVLQIPVRGTTADPKDVGTGAIMSVPAHDERDFEFAHQFDLPIVEVVSPDGALHDELDAAFVGDGIAVHCLRRAGNGAPHADW